MEIFLNKLKKKLGRNYGNLGLMLLRLRILRCVGRVNFLRNVKMLG